MDLEKQPDFALFLIHKSQDTCKAVRNEGSYMHGQFKRLVTSDTVVFGKAALMAIHADCFFHATICLIHSGEQHDMCRTRLRGKTRRCGFCKRRMIVAVRLADSTFPSP